MTAPRSLALLAAALLLIGCGKADCELHGTVIYAGRTLTYGKVIVVEADGKSQYGEIQPNGSYEVKGLHPGPVKVTVYNQVPQAMGRPGTGRSTTVPEGWFEIPDKYADPEKCGLEITLEAGRNTYNVNLR